MRSSDIQFSALYQWHLDLQPALLMPSQPQRGELPKPGASNVEPRGQIALKCTGGGQRSTDLIKYTRSVLQRPCYISCDGAEESRHSTFALDLPPLTAHPLRLCTSAEWLACSPSLKMNHHLLVGNVRAPLSHLSAASEQRRLISIRTTKLKPRRTLPAQQKD